MNIILNNGKSVVVSFDREGILKVLREKLTSLDATEEYTKYGIGEVDVLLSFEEMQEELQLAISKVETLTADDVQKEVCMFATKKNGCLKQRTVYVLILINISDYVTEFTNCWYYDAVVVRATSEDSCEVVLERRQKTN